MIKIKIFEFELSNKLNNENNIAVWFDVNNISRKDIIKATQTQNSNTIIISILHFTENTN